MSAPNTVPTTSSIFQYPPNFPNGQTADTWNAYFQSINDAFATAPSTIGAVSYAILAGMPGAGLVGFDPGQSYPSNTVGSVLGRAASLAWGQKDSTTTGLTYGYYGGPAFSGTWIAVSDGTVALTPSSTNYVERSDAGTVTANVIGWTTNLYPLAKIVTGSSSITSMVDFRGAETEYYLAPYTGAVATTQSKVNTGGFLYAYPTFLSDAQVADAQTGSPTLDTAAALNAAINAAILAGKKLIVPFGTYSISTPLYCMKWSGTAFSGCSLTMEGEIMAWDTSAIGQASVIIKPTFSNLPAFIIQNARCVNLKNICFIGKNFLTLTAPNYPEMMTNSNFVTGSCRDSRYSPYAGICIDPFGTSVPGDGGYPGMSAYYVASAQGSSGLKFESVRAENFVVGCMISPNGTTQNTEDIEFDGLCSFSFNKVGIAIGQSQSRDVNWRGGEISFCLYCCDGVSYGSQQGYAPNIFGAAMSGKYLFNVPNPYGTQSFHNIYAESFASIGFFGVNNGGPNPVSFIGCNFNFHHFGGIFPDWHFYCDGPVLFSGCTFQTLGSYPVPFRFRSPIYSPITYQSCTFMYSGTTSNEFFLAPTSDNSNLEQNGMIFVNCTYGNDARSSNYGKNPLSNRLSVLQPSIANSYVVPYGSIIDFYTGVSNGNLYHVDMNDNFLSLGTLTVTTGASGTATFTATDGTIINTGDTIYNASSSNYADPAGGTSYSKGWNALGIVTNVAGNVVTISGWPQSLSTGSYALNSCYWRRFHQASTCTTASSTTLTSVTPTGAWANGQHIRGTGIPAGAYIVSGGGTGTLVISKAATASASGVRIYDADVYAFTGTAL